MKKKSALIALLLIIIPIFSLSAANILVPSLELVTYGYLQNSAFNLRTRGDIDFKIEGGYKFGGSIMLGFQSNNLEDLTENTDTLTFRSTSVVIRELFELPINVTYFSGIMDTFGNGQVFRDFFGVEPFSSKYKGYVYFPNGVVYDGIHTIQGTGFLVETASLWDSLVLSLYLYQDGYLGQGKYSIDARSLLNYPNFKMEAFLGTTLGATSLGLYRGGVLLYFKAGETGEFLTQVGIPRWDPAEAFNISLFYFLFEPRVNFGNFSIIMTLFWHPQYYLQAETEEVGSIDINVDFRFGDPNVNRSTGGIENNLVFSTAVNPGEGQFKATFSPYLSVVTSGVIWDFKVKVKAFPFSLTDLVETFIGVRAEF